MDVKVIWLSPEQPSDCQIGYAKSFICDPDESDRQADIQQKQASLIQHYRKEIAEKDKEIERGRENGIGLRKRMRELYDEIATLKAGIEQRDAEMARLTDEVVALKTRVRAQREELSRICEQATVKELAQVNAENRELRWKLDELTRERDALKEATTGGYQIPAPDEAILQAWRDAETRIREESQPPTSQKAAFDAAVHAVNGLHPNARARTLRAVCEYFGEK